MIYQTHIPAFPLDQFVEIFIYFSDVQFEHRLDRFLPNGDTEILIDFHDSPQYIHDNFSLKEIQACNHVWASGLRTEPITIPAGNKSEMMVISFKKGMAAPFFPFPMNELADAVVDADLIWGRDFGLMREQMLNTKDIGERFAIAERFMVSEFISRMSLNPCVAFAVEQMSKHPDHVNIGHMNEKIGYSQKHFTDIFRKQVGITPKSFLKIMRFQKAVAAIDAAEFVEWDRIALECGFYDQAHFINDFKHFSGFTPDVYAKIQTNYQNYVPVG